MKALFSLLGVTFLLTGCNSGPNQEAQALKAKQATIDSMRIIIAKQAVIDSMNAVMAQKEEELQIPIEENDKQIVANSNNHAHPAIAAAPAKKKWSHTAKGAVVGAGTGAITGAIINKKRAEGAIVGSLIGAGVGAGTGAIVDASKRKKERNN